MTKPLVDLIVEQSSSYPLDTILNQQYQISSEVCESVQSFPRG